MAYMVIGVCHKNKIGKMSLIPLSMVLLLLALHEETTVMNPTISPKSFGPFLITRDGTNRFGLALDPTEYEIPKGLV